MASGFVCLCPCIFHSGIFSLLVGYKQNSFDVSSLGRSIRDTYRQGVRLDVHSHRNTSPNIERRFCGLRGLHKLYAQLLSFLLVSFGPDRESMTNLRHGVKSFEVANSRGGEKREKPPLLLYPFVLPPCPMATSTRRPIPTHMVRIISSVSF